MSKNLSRALAIAAEINNDLARGENPIAIEQKARTIDSLVGYRTESGAWHWPTVVLREAGVEAPI